jgi:hypothetical protein
VGSPVLLEHRGVLVAGPATGTPGQDVFETALLVSYGASKRSRIKVNAPLVSPTPIPLEALGNIRLLVARTQGQSLQFVFTQPNGGAGQVIAFSDLVGPMHFPNGGDEITALAVAGVGDLDYLIAGDPA